MCSNVRVCKVEKTACAPFHNIIGRSRTYDGLRVIGVYECETLAGILAYYEEEEVLLLNKIYLLPEFRSRGYSALLLNELKKSAAERGINILAKVYNANADQADKTLAYLTKNGFDAPFVKDIYFIVDVAKAYHSFTQQRFGGSEQLIGDAGKVYTYNEIKANQTLFELLKAYSDELFSLRGMEKENMHSYFFVHNNDILGWFCLELKSATHIHVGFLFSHPKHRHSMLGLRLFEKMFDKGLEVSPDAKMVSFNIDPENKRMLNVYTFIFKDSVLAVIPVWYTYWLRT